MNLRTTFVSTPVAELASLRGEYLEQLSEPQEPLLEVMVPTSAGFRIEHAGETCGYFLVHGDDALFELYLRKPYWVFGEAVFKHILARTSIRRALVKSFDHLFLSSCIAHQTSVRSLGLLVRDYVERPLATHASMAFAARRAELADFEQVARIEQQVFTQPERLRAAIEHGQMLLFVRAEQLLGFGLLKPVLAHRPDVDLGIVVDPAFRNTGIAIYMFHHMVRFCFEHGYRPIAGCAEENLPSRRMGERVGMVARYRLLELRFGAGD